MPSLVPFSKFYLFYFWLCWVFVAACGLSPVAESRGYALVAVCRLLTIVAPLVSEHRLQSVGSVAVHGLSYPSAPPGPGIEPLSPALAGRLLTTGPPGKSYHVPFLIQVLTSTPSSFPPITEDTGTAWVLSSFAITCSASTSPEVSDY